MIMKFELVMPKAGLTNTEGTVGEWKVAEGSFVRKGDVVLEVENEKTTFDVNSSHDGYLYIVAASGTEVIVGGLMAHIYETREAYDMACNPVHIPVQEPSEAVRVPVVSVAEIPALPEKTTGVYVKASPLAKKIAKKAGLDLASVTGTGPNGRVLERDVTKYLNETNVKPEIVCEAVTPIPMTQIRKTIAKNMFESLKSMAQTSASVEVDVTELVGLRHKLTAMEEKLGTRITLNDLMSYAAVKMLKAHPLANATLVEDAVIAYPYVNLSMAVAADYGLTAPVIPGADRLSLVELSKALKDIIVRARDNRLSLSELSGGTFTISNMGIFPVDNFNPIVNPPQSAIVGFGRCTEKPVVYDGEITVRTMMVLSITYDHRVFDGAELGAIMRDLKDYLENPELFLVI